MRQSIGVATILSLSQGIDPNRVEPHIIEDKAKTKNTTDLVSNRTIDLVSNRTIPYTKETGTASERAGMQCNNATPKFNFWCILKKFLHHNGGR